MMVSKLTVYSGKALLAAGLLAFSCVHDVRAGSNQYNHTGSRDYNSSRVTFYRQGSSSTRYQDSAKSLSRPSYARAGLKGSGRYRGPGSFRNQQRMGYFSARNYRNKSEPIPVTTPSAEPNRNHPDYYRQFWRSRLK